MRSFARPDNDKWSLGDGIYDPAFAAYMALIFDPTRSVVDVGASVGKVARFLALRCRRTVVCFEPAPETYKALVANVGDLPNVSLNQAAVGREAGIGQLVGAGTQTAHLTGTSRGETIPVPIVTLDESVPASRNVGLIKIDVEGTELDVIMGARGMLYAFRPIVAVEMIDSQLRRGGGSREAIFAEMATLDYRRAVNKYGATERAKSGSYASDVVFLPDRDWYAPRLTTGYARTAARGARREGGAS